MVNQNNSLIPEHIKISQEEVDVLLNKYSLDSTSKLPKISKKDPALAAIDVEIGDVVKILRTSFVGETSYFRVVSE